MEAKLLVSFNGVPSPSPKNTVRTRTTRTHKLDLSKSVFCLPSTWQRQTTQFSVNKTQFPSSSLSPSRPACGFSVMASSSSSPKSSSKLYVSGLSFRTTEESLRNAFQKFGQLVEVNLVMDRIANRPRGFAFLHYSTEEESQKAIEGMHGKFLDGRVIFVEVAKPRSQLRQIRPEVNPRRY